MRLFACGVICHGGYFRSSWNILDFTVLSCGAITLLVPNAPSWLAPMRAMRACRPLRLISRSPGMRLIVDSLVLSLPAITNLFAVAFLFLFVFAVLGVSLFKGRFASCVVDED